MVKRMTEELTQRLENVKDQVDEEQKNLSEEYESFAQVVRLCPYCGYQLTTCFKGSHDAQKMKCPNCGRMVYLSPLKFRKAF